MKTYVCDMCYGVVDSPFRNITMTEITVRQGIIRKRKVHLCDNCFHQIIEVSRKKRSDNNGE